MENKLVMLQVRVKILKLGGDGWDLMRESEEEKHVFHLDS